MWADLGLDLEKHDALLGALGEAHGDIYLSQENRPQGMGYFDFVVSEVHGLRIRELLDAKAAGRIVVGSFCVFVPEELVLAVDRVSVGLCVGADFGVEHAERYLPRTTYALIKSFFGFSLETANNKRAAMHRLAKLRHANPAPISGLDALLANQVFFCDDPVRFTDSVNALCDELEERIAKRDGVRPESTPRIVISGCPMAVPNWKLPSIIETAGAVVVGEESCIGERGTQNLVSAEGEGVDELIENLVERYFTVDCAVFTPNSGRAGHARQIAETAKADGVIHYALQFCTPYQMEAPLLERQVEAGGIPVLRIDTDYSQEDVGQLRTRVEAFVEQIRH
jgi:benzoyl-CoA reductase/2-hydroxyglutaryl-CoA dehydratase subunit BcrC/BadD/HgdB